MKIKLLIFLVFVMAILMPINVFVDSANLKYRADAGKGRFIEVNGRFYRNNWN